METSIIEIVFLDESKFNVYCANQKQKDKMIFWHNRNKAKLKSFEFIVKGIHTQKQFLTQFNS